MDQPSKIQFQPCLTYFTDKAPFCLSFSHPFSSEVIINQTRGVVFTLNPVGFLLLLSELQVCILVRKFMCLHGFPLEMDLAQV